ncbi:sugar porter family MFS transporter [Megamonas hypermegale]|uniref:sugar porter family MFS transporter n=1 Tax=Megamonas hypermegale TaxID=158847 RepID=UPI0025A4C540|nr:sugar porter family MFS transporter [Megamonas hypermegale]MDM8143552.1 sugar porter family MFS transporter [Megamonas hypermegale]
MENIKETFQTTSAGKVKFVRIFVFVVAGMAGLLFGLDQGVISGALPFIAKEWELTSRLQEWVVSSMMVGAAVGAIVASRLSSGIGRKKSLMIGAALFIVGCLGSGNATSVEMLIGARLILGLSVGIASYTAPLYLAEMSDKNARGSIISGYQLMVTVGILVAFLSDTYFSYTGDWRAMLMVIAIPAVLLILCVLALPESPRWLASKGRFQDSADVLSTMHANVEIAKEELHDIKENLKVKQAGWELFKANKNVRRAVFLGVLLQFMQQLTGFNIIMYYSPKILSIAGFSSTEEQMIGTVVNGLVFVLATFIAVGTVDKSGRKPALKRCFAIMAVSLFVLGVCFFGLESGSTASWIPYLSAGMVLLAIIGFGFGAGPVVWILCSEIQPLKSRDFGIACSTMTNWLSCTLIGATFLTLLDTLGSTMTFWLYALLNALFVYLTIRYVPETKGVTLEKIEQNLMEGKKLKDIGC